MKLTYVSKLICSILLIIAAVVPVYGAGHYALAYWREVGYNENNNNHSMYVHVFDENGAPKSGVNLRTTWNTDLGTTDANGYCEVIVSVANSYDMVCVDSSGSTSDVAYTMTSRRWPNWGHYSYNLAFMYKSDKNSPGTFDTSLIGTLNLVDSGETDAPCTESLTYYNLNPLNWYSDPLKLGTSSNYFGQTFVANANRIVACKIQATTGFQNHMRWSAQILQGGPTGTPIGPVKTTREMVSDEYHPILVTWGINDVPVTPGNTYFLKVWSAAGGQMNSYHCESNNYADGSYYENTSSIPNFDIKGLVVAANVEVAPIFGRIAGSVNDTSDTPISGATVSTTTGGYSTTTAADGSYTLANVAPGTYNVVATKTLRGSQTLAGKSVIVNQTTSCNFVLSAPQVISTIGQLKEMADGPAVSLLNKVVSRKGTSVFWVQEEDRSSGIKVNGSTTASEGTRINVAGFLSAENGERVLASPEIGTAVSGLTPTPLGMANKSLSGANIGSHTSGAASARGANNVGLLVSCWGRVTCAASDCFYIDDASATSSNQSCRGIKVSTGALVEPLAGKLVRVNGISGLEANGESFTPVLRVFKQRDILSIKESDLPLGTVSGRVASGASGLGGAAVQTTDGAYTTTTDSNGYYTLGSMESGVYDISASKSGYATQTASGKTVTDAQTLTVDFNLALLPGSISGQVTDANDAPLSGATVSTNIGGYSVATNASGNYTLAGVAPGTYNVIASKPGYITQSAGGMVVNTAQATSCSFKLQAQPPFSGIANGNIEAGFRNDPDVDHQTANSWSRYVLSGAPKSGGDYVQYHSSHWSQTIYESNWISGIYQRATNAVAGRMYTASAWVKGSSSDVKFWVGIDPSGSANAGAASVQWSAQVVPGSTWTQVTKTVAATGSNITIFIKAQNSAVINNYAWIDDAALTGP